MKNNGSYITENKEVNYHIFEERKLNSAAEDMLYIVVVMTSFIPSQITQLVYRPCTGTMIKSNVVLTTASCLFAQVDDYINPDNTIVYRRSKPRSHRVINILIHPNYYVVDEKFAVGFDFAILIMEKSTQTVFPRLPENFQNFEDIKARCHIGGYGSTKPLSLKNFQIHKLNDTGVQVLKCPLPKLCLSLENIMSCREDPGSPLICDGVLFAIYTPWSNNENVTCGNTYMFTFSPVFKAMDWIVPAINSPSPGLEWINNPWYVLLLVFVVFVVMGSIYKTLIILLQKKYDSESLEEEVRPVEEGVGLTVSQKMDVETSSFSIIRTNDLKI